MRNVLTRSGQNEKPPDARSAFTILELMVVIALVGLISVSVVGVSMALLRDKPVTGEEAVRNAVATTRRQAVLQSRELSLGFDKKANCFVISSGEESQLLGNEMKGPLEVEFLPPNKDSSMLIGGDVLEGGALKVVLFFPDGACQPFRAQIRTGGAARSIAFDPWTCAEIKDGKAAK